MKIFFLRFVAFITVLLLTLTSAVFVYAEDVPSHISAKSAVLAEGDGGSVIWSKNGSERLPMASTTKIMTALCALENFPDIKKAVTIDGAACGVEGSSVYLKVGETLTMEELLFALLLESANDAAAAIAIEISGSIDDFAILMNDTAHRLGMKDSHFVNPHGLDHEDHYTTAEDMARLTVAALKNKDFSRIVSTYRTTIPLNGDEGTRLLLNHNKLLKYYDGAIGVKTGFTKKSGRCLVSAAERDGTVLVAVTLCAPDDWNDHRAMLDYGFSSFRQISVANVGELRYSIPITGGTTSFVAVTNKEECHICAPVSSPDIRYVVEAPRFLFAPVKEGDRVGYVRCFLGDRQVARLSLYATSSSEYKEKPSLWKRILELY